MTTTPEPLLPVVQGEDLIYKRKAGWEDDGITIRESDMAAARKITAKGRIGYGESIRRGESFIERVEAVALGHALARLSSTPASAVPDASGLWEADVAEAAKRVCVALWGRERPSWETPIWDQCIAVALAALSRPTSTASGDGVDVPDDLRRLSERATPGEWQVQDGCSWRRIGTIWHDGDVLCPTTHHRDGHPDLTAADGRGQQNLAFIVAAVNWVRSLLTAAPTTGDGE